MSVPDQNPTGLPAWFPAWGRELSEVYQSGTSNVFLLHGNVYDVLPLGSGPSVKYVPLSEFLATQLFGRWDLVIHYDLARGLRALAPGDAPRHRQMVTQLAKFFGTPGQWPADPQRAMALVDRMLETIALAEAPSDRLKVALLIDYAQYLAPDIDPAHAPVNVASNLAMLTNWARSPYLKRSTNVAFCLIAETLSELSIRLVRNPHTMSIEIPLPGVAERRQFIDQRLAAITSGESAGQPPSPDPAGLQKDELARREADLVRREQEVDKKLAELSPPAAATPAKTGPALVPADGLAQGTAGLTLVNVEALLKRSALYQPGVDVERFRRFKKQAIEQQCGGLLDFIEPVFTLDVLIGSEAIKERLRQDAELLRRGRLDAAPMGYLVCGPVGTGKSFLAECYAGSVGIPAVTLKNFRSKYVGETEANLERILNVLRAMGPVVVIVDEADAALGDRSSSGDSGTSSRVFSQIASQMGNTRYRGRILWMLLTSRPDLLPIDLKRQGRAEVHLPLLPPDTSEQLRAMFKAMAKKNKITLDPAAIPDISPARGLTGADIESILLDAHRCELLGSEGQITIKELEAVVERFVPSAQSLEKELQLVAAVLETTNIEFLPEKWREHSTDPIKRMALSRRLDELRGSVR